MKARIVLATRNQGKVAEFQKLFQDIPDLEIISLDSVPPPPVPDVIEDGETFEHNARKKALEVAHATGMMTLADDSGIEVDELDGAPGVYSARFSGKDATKESNNRKLLALLGDLPDQKRTARFRCVLAFADPSNPSHPEPSGGFLHLEHGVCEGRILREPRGTRGFGYDPVFQPEGESLSMAELSPERKNRISHRGLAARRMRDFLSVYLRQTGARR
jgi:XTP/dITP diphosphohydrolase